MTGVRPDEQRRALGFGVRGVLAGLALGLVAVPFGLLLFLVEDKWPPLLRIDDGARDGLHAFAVAHRWFVVAMETLGTIGRWWVYLPVFPVLAGWLLWRRLARLARVRGGDRRCQPGDQRSGEVGGPSGPAGADQPGRARKRGELSQRACSGRCRGVSVLLLVFLPILHGVTRRVAIGRAVLMVLGIGLSRVALGVHYVSDVLAGYALGAAWVTAMIASFNVWRRQRGIQPHADPKEGLEPERPDRPR